MFTIVSTKQWSIVVKIAVIIFSFFILSATFTFVYAQDASAITDKKAEIREDFKANVEATQERREDLRTEVIKDRADIRDVRGEIRDDFRESVDRTRQKRDELRAQRSDRRGAAEERRDELQKKRADRRGAVEEKRDSLRGERADRRESVEEKRAEIKEKRAERREALQEKKKNRIKAYAKRIIRRLGAATERLTKVADRIESRILKLEERGFDLSVAQDLLDTALEEIVIARIDIDEIEFAVEEALLNDNPKEAFGIVRELLRGAKDSIKAAHRALVDAIREVKAGVSVRPPNEVGGDEENNSSGE